MTKKDVPRMEPDEIKRVAKGLIEGHVFTADMCPPDMIPMVFMPVAFGGLTDVNVDQLGNVYEWLDKAGERGINGYPMFVSAQLVHADDWTQIVELAVKIDAAVRAAME